MKKKILFFGDFGIDDALALIYAYLSGEFDIVAIVADSGNMPRNITVRNAHYLLSLLGKTDVQVITGAEIPMSGEYPVFFPHVHGPQGLGPIIPEMEAVNPPENFCEVIKVIEKYKNELIIVNTGRLTSLAALFVLYGDLMKQIKAYYIMGGAFLVPGNVTPVAEANFYGDPVAANIVMQYARNVSIYPLNVTMKAIVTPEMVNYVNMKGKIKIVKPLLDFYFDFYKKNYPFIQGSPVHDLLTMSAVIFNEMFRYVYLPVEIVTDKEEAIGQSIADFRTGQNIYTERSHRIAIDMDYNKFFNHFMSIMTS